jgi:tetratricopeptide (TPR) repeat protein
MDKKHGKLMTDLQRILATQDFKSEEELNAFLNKLVGQEIPSFPSEALSFEEQAQDLVFEAYELPPAKAKKNVIQALELDCDCIEAYEYLGLKDPIIEIGIAYFNMGITIGREVFGGEYLEKHKGMFWGLHETRSFMRCMQGYANSLYSLGKVEESIAIMEEMIELNPNDNQGVRDLLLLYLLEVNEFEKFEKYAAMFEGEESAFYLFNKALSAFKNKGEGIDANRKLSLALKQNKFVVKKLLSDKEITNLPDMHSFGDENEADSYVFFAQFIWQNTDGALAWLKKHSI